MTNSFGQLGAAVLGALALTLIYAYAPRWGAIIGAIVVILMATTAAKKGLI